MGIDKEKLVEDFSSEQEPEKGFSTEEVKNLFENWQSIRDQQEDLKQQNEPNLNVFYETRRNIRTELEKMGKGEPDFVNEYYWDKKVDEKVPGLVEGIKNNQIKHQELQRQRFQLREKLKETKDADGFPTPEAWIEIAAELEQEKHNIPLKIEFLKDDRRGIEYNLEEFKKSLGQRKDLSLEQFQEYVMHYEGKLSEINAEISSLSQRYETIERMLKEGRFGKW